MASQLQSQLGDQLGGQLGQGLSSQQKPLTQDNTNRTILIQNLDSFITETMLFQKLKDVGEITYFKLKVDKNTGESKGQALAEFKDQRSVNEAIERFNGSTFFDSADKQNQKKMYVMKKLDRQQMEDLKINANVFFKYKAKNDNSSLSVKDFNEKRLRDYLSKFGEIHSLKFKKAKGKNLQYGTLTFMDADSKKKLFEGKDVAYEVIDGYEFKFFEYQAKKEAQYSVFCKDFPDIKPLTPSSPNLTLQQIEEEQKKYKQEFQQHLERLIENKMFQGVTAKNLCEICPNFDDKKRLPFAFVNFKNEDLAEELDEILKEIKAYSKIIYPKGAVKHSNKTLVIQNLKAPVPTQQQQEGQSEEKEKANTLEQLVKGNQEIAEKLTLAFNELGYTGFNITVFAVPAAKDSQSTVSSSNNLAENQSQQKTHQEQWSDKLRQGKVEFSKRQDAENFLVYYKTQKYHEKIKTLFIDNLPRFNVLLNKTERTQYKESTQKGKSNFQKQQNIELTQKHMEQLIAQQTIHFNHFQQTGTNQFNQPILNQQGYNRQNQQPPRNQNYPQNFSGPNQQRYQGGNNAGQRQFNNNPMQNPQRQNNAQYSNNNPNQPNNYFKNPSQNQSKNFPNLTNQQQVHSGQIPQQNLRINNNPNVPQQINNIPGQKPPVVNANVQQQNTNANQFQNLQQIKDSREQFVAKKEDEQKLILGKLIYPKVQNYLNKADNKYDPAQKQAIIPKITGMLIDFSVFEIDDIIDMLEQEEEFVERVNEAIELINSQATQQQ